jgi:hypothetical protein
MASVALSARCRRRSVVQVGEASLQRGLRGGSSSQARPSARASGVAASWISSGTTNSRLRMLGRPTQGW